MNKHDVIRYQEEKKARLKAEHAASVAIHGHIGGFSDKEFNQSMKLVQSKGKSAMHLKYSHNAIYRGNDLPKGSVQEIVLGGKIYKKVVR